MAKHCKHCHKQLFNWDFIGEIKNGWLFKCQRCKKDTIVEKCWAKFIHENGKTFLNRKDWGNCYQEVEVVRGEEDGISYLQVVPEERSLKLK